MTTQRCVQGTIAGGITLFVLGGVLYGLVFAAFFTSNSGSATGVEREAFRFWSLGLGQLVWGGLLTLVLGWKGVETFGGGLKTGATLGFLFSLGLNLVLYGTTNIFNLTAALVDPILTMVLFGCGGGVVGVVLGREARA